MRAFLGIALPSQVRESLATLQAELSGVGADVGWVKPEQLHVTLKFLDDISEEQRQAIEAILTRVAEQEACFSVAIHEPGAFPSVRAPRVLWVSVREGQERIVRIAHQIEEEARRLSLRREERPFAAHITLGRVRSPRHRIELAQRLQHVSWQPPPPWHVTALTLYQSVLSSVESRYRVLADIPLSK